MVDQGTACAGTLADDLLNGAEEIAAFTYGAPIDEKVADGNRRRIYHLVDKHNFPAFKLGGVISARKSKIMTWIEQQEIAAQDRIKPVDTDRNEHSTEQHQTRGRKARTTPQTPASAA